MFTLHKVVEQTTDGQTSPQILSLTFFINFTLTSVQGSQNAPECELVIENYQIWDVGYQYTVKSKTKTAKEKEIPSKSPPKKPTLATPLQEVFIFI